MVSSADRNKDGVIDWDEFKVKAVHVDGSFDFSAAFHVVTSLREWVKNEDGAELRRQSSDRTIFHPECYY